MGRWRKASACERAAQWISLELDDELSELEQAALARHLDGCGRCRELRAEIGALTRLLRQAALAVPAEPIAVVTPPAVRRRRAMRRSAVSLAFAGVAAASAAAALVVAPRGGSVDSALSFRSLKEQQRYAHVQARRLEPTVFDATRRVVESQARRVLV